MKLLLESGAGVNVVNGDKFSALHSAVRSQFGDIATLLLQHGADFNLADGKGRTPLQLAQRRVFVIVFLFSFVLTLLGIELG